MAIQEELDWRLVVLFDFPWFFLVSIGSLVVGRVALELSRSRSFRSLLRWFEPRVVAHLIAVTVIFGLPFTYSAWVVWRECDGAPFILITSTIVMFQMGTALEEYARLAFSRQED